MKRLYTLLVIILFILAGCGGCNSSGTQSDDFITVDVTASYPKKELILQDFLDVEYIPLETTEEFITFGHVKAIGKDFIMVRNMKISDANIFIFDRKGNGVRKINRKGQGNGEYAFMVDVFLIEEDEELYVSCLASRKIFVYDLLGNFKRSFKFKEGKGLSEELITYRPIYRFDQDHLICRDHSSGRMHNEEREVSLEPRNLFFMISKQDGSVTEEIRIPFEKKISQVVFTPKDVAMVRNEGLTPYQDRWLLVEPSADTIYSYSADQGLKPFIVRTPSVQSMNPEVFLFPGVITDRFCFMQAVKKEYDETDPYGKLARFDWVYDKKEKKTSEYVVYNDDFTDKRPIKNLVYEVLTLTVVNSDEIAFAERIEASELVEAYEKGRLTGKLKEIAARLDEESNPVIMLAKYKK